MRFTDTTDERFIPGCVRLTNVALGVATTARECECGVTDELVSVTGGVWRLGLNDAGGVEDARAIWSYIIL